MNHDSKIRTVASFIIVEWNEEKILFKFKCINRLGIKRRIEIILLRMRCIF